jgi:hypothetical protein
MDAALPCKEQAWRARVGNHKSLLLKEMDVNNPTPQDNLAAQPSKCPSDLEVSESCLEPECSPNHKSPHANTPAIAKTLVLDDFLAVIEEARSSLKMPSEELSLGSLGLSQKTSSAVTRLLKDTIELHQGQVFTMVNALLEPVGDDIYGEEIKTVFAPRHQVSPERQWDVLRRVLELGLQIVVALPSKDSAHLDRKAQKSLVSALRKVSEKLRAAVRDDRLRGKLDLLPAKPEFWKVPWALQEAAETLESAANLKVTRIRRGSPNPQIRYTLYLANWVKTCTGRPHYALLADLIEAAFQASGKKPPKWINRLEIEMTRQNKYRARLVQILLAQPHPLSVRQPPAPPNNLTN